MSELDKGDCLPWWNKNKEKTMNKITEKHKQVAMICWENDPYMDEIAQILADAFPEPAITYMPPSLDPKERIKELEKIVREKDELLKLLEEVVDLYRGGYLKTARKRIAQYEAQKGKVQ